MGSVRNPRASLALQLNLHRASDAEVKRLLRQAASDLALAVLDEGDLLIGDAIRQAQLRVAANQIMNALWKNVGRTATRGKLAAVERAGQLGIAQLAELLGGVADEALLRSTEAAARRAVERAIARLSGVEARELSARVFANQALSEGRISRLINSALARNLTARELAREARRFILPTTSGGASYAAFRLARTEINNSFHAASVSVYDSSPYIDKVAWSLSRSHPRPDVCDQIRASGPYNPEDVPSKPHPQCFCYIYPAPVDDDVLIRRINRRIASNLA